MVSMLRDRMGIPGLIAVIALVFAMSGGAFAAKDIIGGEATSSATKKGKPGPRGPRGKTGPAGPAGPAGPVGPAGAKGDRGDTGSPGTNGSNGANGESVKTSAAGAECPEGGTKFEVGGTTKFVCNGEEGEEGEPGEPGSPWTAGGTLPEGETLTGVWSIGTVYEGSASIFPIIAPLSFPIPLEDPIPGTNVHYNVPSTADCPGTVLEPKAKAGHLCVYKQTAAKIGFVAIQNPAVTPTAAGASEEGAILSFQVDGIPAAGWGTWAVTAAEEEP